MNAPGMCTTIPVLLLKTRSTPNDNYEDYFCAPRPFEPTFIPVLEHKIYDRNLEEVRSLILENQLQGPNRKYGGLIFTSQRAVEAFGQVVQEVEGQPAFLQKATLNTSTNPSMTFPLYTVGPATSRTLNTILSESKILQLYESSIHGADTGNGEALAHFILSHYNSIYRNVELDKPPLLFLVGEQRRDIIPKTLTSHSMIENERISVDELIVYITGVMDSFPEDFEQHLGLSRQHNPQVICIVVFSPSGCEAMLRCLEYINSNGNLTTKGQRSTRWSKTTQDGGGSTSNNSTPPPQKPKFCIVSIGPTTRDHLRKTWGFEVDFCAEKPSPEGVGEGITRFLRSHSIRIDDQVFTVSTATHARLGH